MMFPEKNCRSSTMSWGYYRKNDKVLLENQLEAAKHLRLQAKVSRPPGQWDNGCKSSVRATV